MLLWSQIVDSIQWGDGRADAFTALKAALESRDERIELLEMRTPQRMRIVILNGPPRSGKDYVGLQLGLPIVKMAAELKERTHAFYRLTDDGAPWAHDHFEDIKDTPSHLFLGLTPREAYIAMSETFAKPTHGKRVFGDWLVQHLKQLEADGTKMVVITDAGFRDECEAIVEEFGASNCLLARIHREGYDFSSDSRSYLNLTDLGVQCQDVTNCGSPEYARNLKTLLSSQGW